jgi:hypothetical protein
VGIGSSNAENNRLESYQNIYKWGFCFHHPEGRKSCLKRFLYRTPWRVMILTSLTDFGQWWIRCNCLLGMSGRCYIFERGMGAAIFSRLYLIMDFQNFCKTKTSMVKLRCISPPIEDTNLYMTCFAPSEPMKAPQTVSRKLQCNCSRNRLPTTMRMRQNLLSQHKHLWNRL